MEETWKDIPGYEGLYQITEGGKVRNLDRKVKIYSKTFIRKGRILKFHISCGGYYSLRLTGHDHHKCYFLHRLMAMTFIPNPNGYKVVNHIDCNKLNNAISNLEWCTTAQNNQHSYDNGRNPGSKKISFKQVCEIRALRKHLKMPNRTLAAMYGAHEDYISMIVHNRLRVNA